MKILGIDPGLRTVGIGLVEATSVHDIRAIEWLTIETASSLPASERLAEIHRDLKEFVTETTPDLAVVEKLFFETNVQTAMGVAEARGVLLLTLAECGVPMIEPTPLQLKSTITGDGKADKRQVQEMLLRMLNLNILPKPDDAADALALAVYGVLSHAMINV